MKASAKLQNYFFNMFQYGVEFSTSGVHWLISDEPGSSDMGKSFEVSNISPLTSEKNNARLKFDCELTYHDPNLESISQPN